MKICILTLPFNVNYGGVLQAYALQSVLENLGHEVWVEKKGPNKSNLLNKLKGCTFVRLLFGKKPIRKQYVRQQPIQLFIDTYIHNTPVITKKKQLIKNNFDAYIVGSDQVWRLAFSPSIYHYFLDFTANLKTLRIAYAASFGLEEWQYSKMQTLKIRKLIKKFDSVLVREDSAVTLCERELKVKAKQVVDPTLLLQKQDYLNLISIKNITKNGLLCYILGFSEAKNEIINEISKKLNFVNKKIINFKNLENHTLPSMADWLKSFVEAEYIITDSFHGTVFSILFNIPFIVIAHKSGGLTRIRSLLSVFGLEKRLIFSKKEITEDLIKMPIDFTKINKIREEERLKSLSYLSNLLK